MAGLEYRKSTQHDKKHQNKKQMVVFQAHTAAGNLRMGPVFCLDFNPVALCLRTTGRSNGPDESGCTWLGGLSDGRV